MDTNLKENNTIEKEKIYKKGKQFRAFLYRMLFMGSLFVLLASVILGWNALSFATTNGFEVALSGKFYIYPAFHEFMDTQFYRAMLYYAGAGNANGYILSDTKAQLAEYQARKDFNREMGLGDGEILYYIESPKENRDNTPYNPFTLYSDSISLPDGYRLCYYWNGSANTLSFYANDSDTDYSPYILEDTYLTNLLSPEIDAPYEPALKNAKDIRIILAVKTDAEGYTQPTLETLFYEARSNQAILVVCMVSAASTLLFGLFSLFTRKACAVARISYSRFAAKVVLELKLLCLVLLGLCFYKYFEAFMYLGTTLPVYTLPPLALFFPAGCLFYPAYTDCKINGKKIFLQSLFVKFILYIREYISSLSWYRKALTMSASLLAGSVLCVITGLYMITLNLLAFTYSVKGTIRRNELEIIWYSLGGLLIMAGIFLLIMFIRARRLTKDLKAVTAKISSMQAGKETAPLKLSCHSMLHQTSIELNTLEDGIEAAVEQRDRSNRMRVELITNVSHDLKTPLTSIINYADLLCEEPLSPVATDYATALQKKAYRLKTMVEDVFTLSKATSGNLPVEKHTLDLARLLKQTLADMEEQILKSTLTFKTAIPELPVWVEADGDRLYRVFQNLFINALQYSLENSRVHITLSLENDTACVKVKNTSKEELNFDTREITERFVRADASRTTEGSGLGLSIAQSFTEACGGTFRVETDADMFIAVTEFPLATEAPSSTEDTEGAVE